MYTNIKSYCSSTPFIPCACGYWAYCNNKADITCSQCEKHNNRKNLTKRLTVSLKKTCHINRLHVPNKLLCWSNQTDANCQHYLYLYNHKPTRHVPSRYVTMHFVSLLGNDRNESTTDYRRRYLMPVERVPNTSTKSNIQNRLNPKTNVWLTMTD